MICREEDFSSVALTSLDGTRVGALTMYCAGCRRSWTHDETVPRDVAVEIARQIREVHLADAPRPPQK